MRLKGMVGIVLAYGLFMPLAYSQEEVLSVAELPVVWQPAERWQWQGQDLSSQRFSSQQHIANVAQHIQNQLQGVDLRVQRLASAWLLSFDHPPTHTHYLFLLSAQTQGTEGWMSTMRLTDRKNHTSAFMLPALFSGLYQHSWHIREVNENNTKEPLYVLLQPNNKSQKLWRQLNARLIKQNWQGGSCLVNQWCQWHKNSQTLWLWMDPKQGLWHVLWWPK